MYGIGEHNSTSLAPWRLMFIVCGILTSACGVAFFFIMPAGPETAWFLTPEERIVASRRLASQHDGGDKTNFSVEQLKEAVLDFKSYAAFAFGVLVTVPSPILTVSGSVNFYTLHTDRNSSHPSSSNSLGTPLGPPCCTDLLPERSRLLPSGSASLPALSFPTDAAS